MEVQALRNRGWSYVSISRHIGCDWRTVKAYLEGREPGVRRQSFAGLLRSRNNGRPALATFELLRTASCSAGNAAANGVDPLGSAKGAREQVLRALEAEILVGDVPDRLRCENMSAAITACRMGNPTN